MIGLLAMAVPGTPREPSAERRGIIEGIRETDRLREVAQEATDRLVQELEALNERFRLVRRARFMLEESYRREDGDVQP